MLVVGGSALVFDQTFMFAWWFICGVGHWLGPGWGLVPFCSLGRRTATGFFVFKYARLCAAFSKCALITGVVWAHVWPSRAFAPWSAQRGPTRLGAEGHLGIQRAITLARSLERCGPLERRQVWSQARPTPPRLFDARWLYCAMVAQTFEGWLGQ